MVDEQKNSDIITLAEAEVGKRYQVVNVKARGAVNQRMMDMGLVPGSRLWVIRYAPLGDPIEIRIRRFLLSLRKEEARDVEVLDMGYHHSHHHMRKEFKGHGKGWMRHHRWKYDK